MIIRPDYIEAIKPFIDAPLVKILAGVRRCGKSTILAIGNDNGIEIVHIADFLLRENW